MDADAHGRINQITRRKRKMEGNLPDEARGPYSRGEVAETIKQWMKTANLTQQALASRLKISQSVISRQILGKENMSLKRLRQFIAILEPPVDEAAELLGQFDRDGRERRRERGRERRYLISLLYLDRWGVRVAQTYGTFIGLNQKGIEAVRECAAQQFGVPVKDVVILSAMELEE